MKRILIDGRFVGVGDSQTRYVLELVRNILNLDHENEYTLLIRPVGIKELPNYFNIEKLDIEALIVNCKLKIKNLSIEVLDIPHYSVAEQTKFLSYLNKEKFDLVHFTQFNHPVLYRGKFVTTIQDLTLVGHLHYHNFAKKLAYKSVMGDAAKRSQKIIAISNTTMDDVMDYFHTPKSRFAVIYHGVDHERFKIGIMNKELGIREFKSKHGIKGEYIFYAGMWKKHKNLIRLFQAYGKFITDCHPEHSLCHPEPPLCHPERSEGSPATQRDSSVSPQNDKLPQLVLAGKVDENEPEVIAEIDRINSSLAVILSERSESKDLSVHNSILAIGSIDEELPAAYAGALAYVIPSLSEGFGWPPLEAMACGTPVIASRISCIPEILGNAPLYFDPYHVNDISNAIQKVTCDAKLRDELIEKGLEQVKKYNWAETAKKTLAVYKEVLI